MSKPFSKLVYPKLKAPKPPKPVRFEQALKWLRAGKPVRRRSWHEDSKLVRIDQNIFCRLPGPDPATQDMGGALNYPRPPQRWQPYASDFLATDWTLA
jgi:hypothetical protein